MVTLDFLQTFLYENLEQVTVSSGGRGVNFVARCPICGDSRKSRTKKRFHLKFENEESICYHCFNCNASGSFFTLYAHVKGLSSSAAYRELMSFDPDRIKKSLSERRPPSVGRKIDFSRRPGALNEILDDCVEEGGDLSFRERRLLEELERFRRERRVTRPLFVAHRGKYSNRIIIPVYDGDDIVYFQGRAISPSTQPKYLNACAEKEAVIVNREKFQRDKYIVVTEGILDADSVGTQGTACLGASIKEEFVEELAKYTDEGIIIGLDNDPAGYNGLLTLTQLLKGRARYYLTPKEHVRIKDFNELVCSGQVEDVYSFVVKNSYDHFTAVTKMKMERWRK
jgi:DNA primase